jgi:NAD(P)-dependent dehydrogenase (short-subunit alcohol dehydrogenase family)
MPELGGRVVVLLDNGTPHGPHVARALAEAGVCVVTVHGQGRAPEGRAHLSGDPSEPLDVATAKEMARELFGPVDAVIDVADLPDDDSDRLLQAVERRLEIG